MAGQDNAAEVRRLKAMIEGLNALLKNNVVNDPTMERLQLEIDDHWARLAQLGVHRLNEI